MCMLSHFSHIQHFVTLWTVTRQSPLSMGFSRQEYWSRLPCPPPGDLPDPCEMDLTSLNLLHWLAGSLPLVPPGKHTTMSIYSHIVYRCFCATWTTMSIYSHIVYHCFCATWTTMSIYSHIVYRCFCATAAELSSCRENVRITNPKLFIGWISGEVCSPK